MKDTDNDLVTINAACEILGGKEAPLNPSTLYKGIKRGVFPAPLKLGPGTSRWRRSELLAVLESVAKSR